MRIIELKDVFGGFRTIGIKEKDFENGTKEFKELVGKIQSKEYTVLISCPSILNDDNYMFYLGHQLKRVSLLFEPNDMIYFGAPNHPYAVVYSGKLTDRQIDILTTKAIIH